MLVVADDALKSAAEAGDKTSKKLDKKFGKTINLLSGFEKDFSSKHPMSDPNTGEEVTRKAKKDRKSKSPLTSPSAILHALEKKLHSKVKIPSVSLLHNADESQPMGDEWPELTRVVKFHLLASLPDVHPIVVECGCYAINDALDI